VSKELLAEIQERLGKAGVQVTEARISHLAYALEMLSSRKIIELDDDKRATMVSNLLVVLCSERNTTPVINAGSLY
jgi:hypothetical protein